MKLQITKLCYMTLLITGMFSAAFFAQSSQWEVYTTANSRLPMDTVYALAYDNGRSSMWVGTYAYIAELKGSNWTVFDPNVGNNPNGAKAIAITPDDSVWAGGGWYDITSIDEFNGTSWSTYNNNIFSISDITSMVYDRSGQILWIATNSDGLIGRDMSSKTFVGAFGYSEDGGLNDDGFLAMALDSSGSLWLSDATYGQGMEKLNYFEGSQPAYTDTLVYQQFDGTSSLPEITNPALPTDGPLAIAVDPSNFLWLGTKQKGVMKFDGKLVTQFSSNTTAGFLNDHVNCEVIDKCGDIWAGTNGGAAEYDGSTWQWFTKENSSLPNDTVLSMATDVNGHLWFGTEGGLAEYKPRPHTPDLTLPANASVVGAAAVQCKWQPACPGVTRYWFEIANNSSFTNSMIDSGLTVTSKLDTGLQNNTTYYWRVKAENDAGWGQFSSVYSFNTSFLTGIKDKSNLPKEFRLSQNFPNPFNPVTTIDYQIPKKSFVTIKVFDILGNQVSLLVNKDENAGKYAVSFDASELSSGVYFYSIDAGSFEQTKKLIVLK